MNPRAALAFLLACLLSFALAGVAVGHAELVESEPADGEMIETPATLSATFDEELDPESSRIVVRNAAGEEVARGAVSDEERLVMSVELPELPAGEYVARWTAVTADDRGVTRGTISFAVARAPATDSPAPSPTSSPPPATATAPSPTLSPSVTPSPSPSAVPSPPPIDDEPTAGFADVLMALVLAGAVIGGLALYLLRRR